MYRTLLAILLLASFGSSAQAVVIEFTLIADPAYEVPFGRVNLGGSLTGRLYGLDENGSDQQISGFEFTSGHNELGVRSGVFDIPDDIIVAIPNSFDLIDGVVIAANLRLFFLDTIEYEFRLNDENINALWVNDAPDGLTRANGDGFSGVTYAAVPEPITIDIKPGSDPNCFNVNGHGVIPVAILGETTLDVTTIDVDSLLFGGLQVRQRKGRALCSVEDVNNDDYWDLVCHFEDVLEDWVADEEEATLTGTLYDGTSIEGTDSICLTPKKGTKSK